jgi:hypothetical protein
MRKSGVKVEKILNFLPQRKEWGADLGYIRVWGDSRLCVSLCVCVLSVLRLYFVRVYVFVCFLGGCVQISPSVGCFVLVPSKVSFP